MDEREKDDWWLLRRYLDHGEQEAFAALLGRHLKLVYWSCRRDLVDDQMAEDAAQVVFVLFAQKAASLRPSVSIPGWLFKTARFVAKDARKQEARRLRHEVPSSVSLENKAASDDRSQDAPWLNDALWRLKAAERDAIFLRFFEGASLQEVAVQTGTSEEAARKRIARALDKLRVYAQKQGVAISSVALAALLAADAAKPLPAHAEVVALQTIHNLAAGQPAFPAGAQAALVHKGVSVAMKVAKIKLAAAAILAVGVSAASVHAVADSIAKSHPSPAPAPLTFVVTVNDRTPAPTQPNAQIGTQFIFLNAPTGVYDKIMSLPSSQSATSDQIYAALLKAGAGEVTNPSLLTASGNTGMIAMRKNTLPWPRQGKFTGHFNFPSHDTYLMETPRLTPDGKVKLWAQCRRADPASTTQPGSAPATNTTVITTTRVLAKGEMACVGELPGYGEKFDLVVFVRLVSVTGQNSSATHTAGASPDMIIVRLSDRDSTPPNAPVLPNVSICTQFIYLNAAPGIYQKVSTLPNGRRATGDQIYAALLKAGATEQDGPLITTTSGVKASMTIGVQYKGAPIGPNQNLWTLPQLLPDGHVKVWAECVLAETNDIPKPGTPYKIKLAVVSGTIPALAPGQIGCVGDLQPIPGSGQQTDQIVFARLISVTRQ